MVRTSPLRTGWSALAKRILLLRDDRALRGHLGVEFLEILPIGREVVLVEHRLDRALRDARLAVDALVGVDVHHLVPFVEALDRAHHNAVGVLAGETGLGNDVGHDRGISKVTEASDGGGAKAGCLRGMVGRTPNPVNESNRLFGPRSVSRPGLRLVAGNCGRMIGRDGWAVAPGGAGAGSLP